jgi:hypothetical protein
LGEQDLGIETLAAHDLPLEMGRDIPGATEFLDGTLDEIRIYNRALSDRDVQRLCWQFAMFLPLTIRSFVVTNRLYLPLVMRPIVPTGFLPTPTPGP